MSMKQISCSQSVLESSRKNPIQEYSDNRAESSSEGSSEISSSDEDDQLNVKTSNDHCHEPIFVKV